MASENRSIARYETTAVYTHPEAKVDIVLVHGLNGAPDKTWTAKNGVFWPLDLLPASLKDVQANIMVYGYNADVYSKRNDQSASDNFIHQHAQTLITNLTLYRRSEGTFQNPIIWVCHSLGGILVKRALLYSNDVRAAHHEHHRSIYVSTFGLVFLGTPHVGSDGATWGLVLQAMSDAIIPKKFFESESVLLRTLKKENETLANINSHFLDIYQRFRIHMAHENHKTDLKGTKAIVVDANSASPQLPGVTYYGIEATHSGMCKFDSPSAPGYRNISTDIRQWVLDAPAVIQVRWEVEGEERRARMRNEMSERMSPFGDSFADPSAGPAAGPSAPQARGYTDQEPLTLLKDQTASRPLRLEGPMAVVPRDADEPLFIHPDRFRPNSYFRGREQELYNLHRMLMDRHRRDQGTSAVLIWAVPGGGKSHLAREYAFRHRHDYPGGIFWIRGKTQEDLEDGFLKMAKSASIQEGIRVKDESDLRDPDEVISLVRKWLNRTENWLLILDGVLRDTHVLSKYIPDARNTSMILTSTDISIAGNHKFDSPQKIELGPLSEDDARIMLLEEMDKKKPWTQDDLSRSLETVQLMECLPLAIHAAARQLRATREPLSKYIRAYKTRPRTGGLGAYKGVREKLQERGEIAALNLMYLLSFFSARIPVEMLALGLKALDKRTPVRTHDSMGNRSLNKTFTVLIAFALIERDEIEDVPSASATASSLSASLQNPTSTELLDMLKIHSIVQTFFRETLKKESQFEFWLERAAAVFCKSFDEGDSRARRNPDTGLPDDYRRYAAHARKILEHISRVDRPKPELREAEKALQSRLEDIQGLVSTMSSTATAAAWERHGKDPHVSVFERTNSLSVPSSATSTDSNSDKPVDIGLKGSWDQQLSLPTLEGNPHHYHIPYPQQSMIPVPEFLHDEDNREWEVPSSHHEDMLEPHRTLRRQAVKRYHDRAGAWRETKQKVNEPRVSISREVALGQFSAAASPLSELATSSPVSGGAGQHLAHIKNANNRGLGEAGWNESGDQRVVEREERRRALEEQHSSHDNDKHAKLKRNGNQPASEPVKVQSRAQLPYPSQDTLVDEPPFSQGGSFGTASVPSIYHLDDGERRPRSRGATPRLFSNRHTDTCLETDVDQWAPPGLPIVVSSTSTLGPASHLYRPVHNRRQARDSGYAGEALSSSLPSSQGSTLQPPPWRQSSLNPDGYSSQPLSRIASSNRDGPAPGGSMPPSAVPINTRRSPSMARTEPSPRTGAFENTPNTSYRAWKQRHSGPWSTEQVSPGSAPSPPTDGAEMVRSGSGGIQFNGRIVEFGQSPLAESAYPLEIANSDSVWWEDEDVPSLRKRPLGLGLGLAAGKQEELQPLP